MQGDILSAVLTAFVLLVELAHPSLQGYAFRVQACLVGIAVVASYMIMMHGTRHAFPPSCIL